MKATNGEIQLRGDGKEANTESQISEFVSLVDV